MSSFAQVCFLNFILYRNVNDYTCNLVCVYVYVHKICEDKFGGYTKSFSWLGQKINKKIDAYDHDDDDNSGTDLCPCHDDTSWQDISTLFSILI